MALTLLLQTFLNLEVKIRTFLHRLDQITPPQLQTQGRFRIEATRLLP